MLGRVPVPPVPLPALLHCARPKYRDRREKHEGTTRLDLTILSASLRQLHHQTCQFASDRALAAKATTARALVPDASRSVVELEPLRVAPRLKECVRNLRA